ncbi:MAG: substrate-binding domain-containing protein [Chloroflexi bacterium]|nr:substrate-binding domain-containing protein [Chloroflexota bacterium]
MAKRIGIVTNDQHQVFQSSVIRGVREIAEAETYEIVIDSRIESSTPGNPTDLNLNTLAGIVVIANVLPDSVLRDLYHDGIPTSLISHYLSDTPIPTVIPNNKQGIAKLVEHLAVNCGREKFVFIDGDLNQHDGIERRQAFLQELVRRNLYISPEYMIQGNFEPVTAAANLTTFLEKPRNFNALIAADYLMALRAIDVLQDHGIAVPDDVAVVGFGDGDIAREHGLTTIAADITELGRRSARQLLGQMNRLHIRGTTLLSVELEIRDTCGYRNDH